VEIGNTERTQLVPTVFSPHLNVSNHFLQLPHFSLQLAIKFHPDKSRTKTTSNEFQRAKNAKDELLTMWKNFANA
jgi:hypothetical protein